MAGRIAASVANCDWVAEGGKDFDDGMKLRVYGAVQRDRETSFSATASLRRNVNWRRPPTTEPSGA
jgi:hypothetical protein